MKWVTEFLIILVKIPSQIRFSNDSLPLPFCQELFFPLKDQSLGLKFFYKDKAVVLFLQENKIAFAD